MMSQPGSQKQLQYTSCLISQSKGNQTKKLGQLIGYIKRNISL